MKILLSGVFFCAVISTTATAKPIAKREHNQQVRIHQGIRSGELTRKEAARLEVEQKEICIAERVAKKDGKFSAAERARIQKELNEQSRSIYKQKHDEQERK